MNLLDIINDTSSRVILQCTRNHIVSLHPIGIFGKKEINYHKGDRHPRNLIFLKSGNWKIAAKKYQK